MLKSCKYCGRVHDSKYDCGRKPVCKKIKGRTPDKFRNTTAWKRKREEIRQRDMNLCQCCIRNLPGTVSRLTYDKCSVHHAVPLDTDYDKRLDNDNLLLVCSVHHEMCESGAISYADVQRIIVEQESKNR